MCRTYPLVLQLLFQRRDAPLGVRQRVVQDEDPLGANRRSFRFLFLHHRVRSRASLLGMLELDPPCMSLLCETPGVNGCRSSSHRGVQ
jgi:hypothetical protein